MTKKPTTSSGLWSVAAEFIRGWCERDGVDLLDDGMVWRRRDDADAMQVMMRSRTKPAMYVAFSVDALQAYRGDVNVFVELVQYEYKAAIKSLRLATIDHEIDKCVDLMATPRLMVPKKNPTVSPETNEWGEIAP